MNYNFLGNSKVLRVQISREHHGIVREDWGIGVGRAGAREVGEGRKGGEILNLKGEAAELEEDYTTMLDMLQSKQS